MNRILLLSLRTIKDANIDILHHMDKSLNGISSPLLFLQHKDARKSRKKCTSGRARASEKFLRQQKFQSWELVRVPDADEDVDEGRFTYFDASQQ
jgi:hypothetical protein